VFCGVAHSHGERLKQVLRYGLQMMVTSEPGLSKYLAQVLQQMSDWLLTGSVKKLVLVITNLDNGKPVERYGL
jgi:mitotic spindle assembly checkpoint protein MAD2